MSKSAEEIIKEKTEECINNYKERLKSNGVEFNSMHELLLRQGIGYGISISSMALASLPVDITMGVEQ